MPQNPKNRVMIVPAAIILCTVFGLGLSVGCAGDQPAPARTSSPSLGTWDFDGKDDAGVRWSGPLTIGKLDAVHFDPKTYFALCTLEIQSPGHGMRSLEAPCRYDAKTRTMSFATEAGVARRYTAVLAPNGRSLTDGKWTESQRTAVVVNGQWSAKLR